MKPWTNKARATRYLNSNEACRKGNRKIGKGFGSKTGMKETWRIKGGSRFIQANGLKTWHWSFVVESEWESCWCWAYLSARTVFNAAQWNVSLPSERKAHCSSLSSRILGVFQDENGIKENFMLHFEKWVFLVYVSNVNPKWAFAEENKVAFFYGRTDCLEIRLVGLRNTAEVCRECGMF